MCHKCVEMWESACYYVFTGLTSATQLVELAEQGFARGEGALAVNIFAGSLGFLVLHHVPDEVSGFQGLLGIQVWG